MPRSLRNIKISLPSLVQYIQCLIKAGVAAPALPLISSMRGGGLSYAEIWLNRNQIVKIERIWLDLEMSPKCQLINLINCTKNYWKGKFISSPLGNTPHHQKIEFEWYTALNIKLLIIIRKKRNSDKIV